MLINNVNLINNEKCFGCSACEYFCPTNAIKMICNEQGFWYPVVEEKKCIECYKCEEVCPIEVELNEQGTIYRALHKDEDVLEKSQSGGVFTALSDYILSLQGIIYGAVCDKKFEIIHTDAITKDERDKMCTSKYVQSKITSTLIGDIKKNIDRGRNILFTGTPCQCAMIKKNFGDYKRLFICDFICHGVPSYEVWRRYVEHIEQKNNIKVKKVTFRLDPNKGKGNHTTLFSDESGNEIFDNKYGILFYSHLAHRKSCFQCPFARLERVSDITIGGYLEKLDIKQIHQNSMIIVNTEKGRDLLEKIRKEMMIIEQQESNQYYKNQPCLYHAVLRPKLYDVFWEDFEKQNFEDVLIKYATKEIENKYHIEML